MVWLAISRDFGATGDPTRSPFRKSLRHNRIGISRHAASPAPLPSPPPWHIRCFPLPPQLSVEGRPESERRRRWEGTEYRVAPTSRAQFPAAVGCLG